MGLTGIAVGSFMGLTTKLGSNALQKLPYMRRTSSHFPSLSRTVILMWISSCYHLDIGHAEPWEHVLFVGIGAFTGNYLEKKYKRDLEEVEALRLYLERRPDVTRKD
jgi:hypothetical protein